MVHKLQDAKTGSEVAEIRNTFRVPSDLSMKALASAYARVGESKTSEAWKLRLSTAKNRSLRELSYSKQSARVVLGIKS